jgi:hypothetical protein
MSKIIPPNVTLSTAACAMMEPEEAPMSDVHTDGPMTEYESALSGMVRVLLDVMIDMGAPRQQLAKELKTLKDSAKIQGHQAAAATIEITMRSAGLR